MKPFRIVPAIMMAAFLVPAAAAAGADANQTPGPLKHFKDWVVGCDNLRSCTALGLATEGADPPAYVRITRSGGADDAPNVAVVVYAGQAKAPLVSVALDGTSPPGFPAQGVQGTSDGQFVRATLTGGSARDFASALRTATTMGVRIRDGASTTTATISLAGSAAALLFMDDMQKRVGTVTALLKPGDAPASTIPPVPAMPAIAAVPMQQIQSPPPVPAAIPRSSDENCQGDVIAARLSPAATLWGVCDFAAAYNIGYRFWIVGKGRPVPVSFPLPGETADDARVLVMPAIVNDGLTLEAFDKGRGVGDCGDITDWAWDGHRFRLTAWSRLDVCRGVAPDDWPVLFTARRN